MRTVTGTAAANAGEQLTCTAPATVQEGGDHPFTRIMGARPESAAPLHSPSKEQRQTLTSPRYTGQMQNPLSTRKAGSHTTRFDTAG